MTDNKKKGAKDLDMSEIDSYIRLLDNSVQGKDNRSSDRNVVKIPIAFALVNISGEYIKDTHQPLHPSYIIDISREGAGVLTGRRLTVEDRFYCIGEGEKKVVDAHMEVVNVRKENNQFRYGCKILKFEMGSR